MSRLTVISPNNAGGKRTGLLKVYRAVPVMSGASVADGPVVTVVAIVCDGTVGAADELCC